MTDHERLTGKDLDALFAQLRGPTTIRLNGHQVDLSSYQTFTSHAAELAQVVRDLTDVTEPAQHTPSTPADCR